MTQLPSWPHDAQGNPMAIVTASAADKVETTRFGNVTLFASVTRPVPNGTDQELINHTRSVQRIAEYSVGKERRLLDWAIDPSKRFASPVPEGEEFASPPPDYDPASMPPHPADAKIAENAVAPAKP